MAVGRVASPARPPPCHPVRLPPCPSSRRTVYANGMNEAMNESPKRSIARSILAILVLMVAGWVLLHFLAGIAAVLLTFIVIVVAVVAIVWALRVLL